MKREGMTIRDAAEAWVSEMNAYPYNMIDALTKADIDSWYEVTLPATCDRVYVYDRSECGTITEVEDRDDEQVFTVEMDDGVIVEVGIDDFEVERDSFLPMWGTLWSFGDSADDYWLEECGGIKIMSECGFRVYHHEEFGYIFGIDGAGYSFYEAHWIPLYKKRGFQWHDENADKEGYVPPTYRKLELYDSMLGYLVELINVKSELKSCLLRIGFTEEEIVEELGEEYSGH